MNLSNFIEASGVSVLLIISLLVSYAAIKYAVNTYKDYGALYLSLFAIVNFMFILAPILIFSIALSKGIVFAISTACITLAITFYLKLFIK